MRKILFLLLLTVASYGQTTTGKETKFPYGIRNQSVQTITTPTYLNTQGTDGTQGVIPSAYIEKTANKTSTISGYSETLYPNEKASRDALDLKLNISDLPTNLTLYPTTTASDVSGYVVMVKDIHDVRYNTTAVDVSTPTITTTDQLVSQRISDAGLLIGQPGVFNITTFGNIRHLSGSGAATFYFKVFHRDSAGVETLICTSSISAPVTDGGYSEFTVSGVWDDGDFVASDRIVIKSYANRIAGGSDPIYQFQFGGTSPVRTLLPVPFSVVDAGYELNANKQDSLAIDGTGTKYPTVDAINDVENSLVHKSGDLYDTSVDFNPILSQNTESLNIEKRILEPESIRLDQTLLPLIGWGDSLSANTWESTLATLSGTTVTSQGVGGETSTQIKDRMIASTSDYGKSVIIWAGRNNYTSPTTVKSDIATMISALGHSRYLVVSILNGNYTSEYLNQSNYLIIKQLNEDLKSLYGNKYVSLREYLVSLHNQTSQDLIDFANDVPPTSLRSDNIHLNSAGYIKVAEYLNQRLGNLYGNNGYLQSKDFQYYVDAYKGTGTNSYLAKWENSGKKLINSNIFDYNTGLGIGILSQPTVGLKLNVLDGVYSKISNGGTGFALQLGTSGTSASPLDSKITWYRLSANAETASINCSDASTNTGGTPMIFSTRGASGNSVERARLAREDGKLLINTVSNNLTDHLQVNGTVSFLAGTSSGQGVNKGQLDLKSNLASPTFTGIPTAPTATSGTNTTQIATTAFAQGIRPYKVYTAILTQAGTDAPTAIVLENTIGSIVWSRTIAGGYFATLSGAFTTNKTSVLITNGSANAAYIHGASVSTSSVNVITADDGQIDRATIEIRVYN